MHTIADLKKGEGGKIIGFLKKERQNTLLELGFIPGTLVNVTLIAPLGDPICIEIEGYTISIRKEDAHNILIKPL